MKSFQVSKIRIIGKLKLFNKNGVCQLNLPLSKKIMSTERILKLKKKLNFLLVKIQKIQDIKIKIKTKNNNMINIK